VVCAQHKCQYWLAGPAVVVPRLNVSNGVSPTETSKLPPVYTFGTAAAVVQGVPLATTFALFVATNPVPVTWTTHGAVIGQSFVMVSGPFSVNTPTSKE
jgi:hypothetical protein